MRTLDVEQTEYEVHCLTSEEKNSTLLTTSVLDIVHSQGEYFLGGHSWMALKCDSSGLELASQTSDVGVSYTAEGRRQSDTPVGVSFSGHHQVIHGTKLDVVYYGGNEHDLVSHTLTHVHNHLLSLEDNVFHIFIRFPVEFNYAQVETLLSKYFGERFRLTKADSDTSHIFTNEFTKKSNL